MKIYELFGYSESVKYGDSIFEYDSQYHPYKLILIDSQSNITHCYATHFNIIWTVNQSVPYIEFLFQQQSVYYIIAYAAPQKTKPPKIVYVRHLSIKDMFKIFPKTKERVEYIINENIEE